MIITIDGSSGTGKSTVAKKVAEARGITYFDTGAMYRAYAYWRQSHAEEAMDLFKFSIRQEGFKKKYFVGEEDVTALIRSQEIGEQASKLSQSLDVRLYMHRLQREFAKTASGVFEGRDMGSVVFPDTPYKFFLSADVRARASRRLAELKRRFPDQKHAWTLQQVEEELKARDARDQSREHSPLCIPEGAQVIDTTDLTIDQVVETILASLPNEGLV